MVNPLYVVSSSSGPGKWNGVDNSLTPPGLSWSVIVTSSLTLPIIEGTIDSPSSYGSSVAGTGGGIAINPSSQAPLAFAISSQLSSNTTVTTSSLAISAWRLNLTSSNLTVTATFLQAGVKQ